MILWWDIYQREMSRRLGNKMESMRVRGMLYGFKWTRMPDHWVVTTFSTKEAYDSHR